MPGKRWRYVFILSLCALFLCLSPALAEGKRVYAYAYSVKVYAEPSKKSEIIALTPFARELTLLEEKKGWAQVVTPDNRTGYCSAKQLTEKNPNIYDKTVYAQQDRAPVYECPSVDAPMIGHLNRNDRAKMVAMTPSGDWLRIQYGGHDGYIQRPRVDYKKFAKGRLAWVTASEVAVRYDPGIDSTICSISRGTQVQAVSTHDGWTKIRSGKGLIGYVRSDTLTTERPE